MILDVSITDSKTFRFLNIFCFLLLLFFSLNVVIQAQSDFSGEAFYKVGELPGRFSKYPKPQAKSSTTDVFNRKQLPAADGDIDSAFNASVTEGGGYVSKTVVQPDGKIVVVGYFQRGNGIRKSGITRLNADGTLDTSFMTGTGITQSGYFPKIALQSDGKILVGGVYNYNGQAINAIARLNSDGSLDSTFNNSNYSISINDMLILPNGKILTVGGQGLTRFNSDGTIDAGINNFAGEVNTVALAPDGKIVVGGYFYFQPRNNIARFSADLTLDTTFNPTTGSGQYNSVDKVIIQPNGKILAARNFLTFNDVATEGLVRLNDNGSVDTTFDFVQDTPLFFRVTSLTLQPDGKILAGFNSFNNARQTTVDVRRFNSNGTTDTTFNTNTDNTLYALDLNVLADGSILVGGGFFQINNQQRLRLVKLNSNGSLVNNFNPAFSSVGTIYAIEKQPDGKTIIAGNFFYVNGIPKNLIARLNPDGSLDNTFTTSAELGGTIYDIVVQPNGKIIIGGVFGGSEHFPAQSLARLNADGSYDADLDNNNNFKVNAAYALTLQPDGKVLVGGEIYSRTTNPPPVIFRLNTDGSLDSSFNAATRTGSSSETSVRDILVQPGGKIVIGGFFNPQTNFQRRNIARLNVNGTLDAGFSSTDHQGIFALAQQSDGKVYAGGFGLLRYGSEGTPDSVFNGNSIFIVVFDIVTQPNGKVLVGGEPRISNGLTINAIARINDNGTVDSTFNANTPGTVYALNSQPDGRILVGGAFLDFNNTEKFSLVRIQNSAIQNRSKFDFDGDGRADVSVFRPDNGVWYLQQSSAGFTGIAFGVSTDKIVPADYDGDGKTDVAVYRGGTWYLQRSRDGFTGITFGAADDIPMPADYDGDGKADLAVFRPSNGTWYLQRSQLGFTGIAFGQNGDKPTPADYDGDGKADVAVFRSGTWYLLRSQLGFTGITFGDSNDKPVPADYDGDGKTDVAVFRPSNGTWYLQQSTAGFAGITFGLGTDLPTAADYDGDGKADVAVFRNGTWYLNRSTQGFTGVSFGAATDKPIANAFVQ